MMRFAHGSPLARQAEHTPFELHKKGPAAMAELHQIVDLVLKVARADKSSAATLDAPAVMKLIARSDVLRLIEDGLRDNRIATAKMHAAIAEKIKEVRDIDDANDHQLVERVRAAIPSAFDHACPKQHA